MRTPALEFLACPSCWGRLVADAEPPSADGHIMNGVLACGCGANYPIRDGVPRLTPDMAQLPVDQLAAETAKRFGVEWQLFDQKARYYEQQFLDWIAPLTANDFADRVVLEGGCGKGRHTKLVANYGAKAIVSVDLGNAVDVAFRATRHLNNVHIAQGDIVCPPVARVFDLAFSIGVLHHLPEPGLGFLGLKNRVVAGGRIAVWVYGYESNEWIVRFVDPVRRKVTSRIPERMLYWLSLPPACALTAALRLYRSHRLAKRLPYSAYLSYISQFPLREVHHIMFDQLVTPVSHYLREEEVQAWFDDEDLEAAEISWHNQNSWRGQATVITRENELSHAESRP